MPIRQFVLLLNVIFVVLLVSGGLGGVLGIRASARRALVPDEPSWRNKLALAGVVSAALAGLLLAGCVIRTMAMNEWAGQNAGGIPTSFIYLRIGTYLSLAAAILGLGGKGKGRWLAFGAGCFLLLFWIWMGIPE